MSEIQMGRGLVGEDRPQHDSATVRPVVYLDWNATTPLHPAVLAAMHQAASATWANPSSVHSLGRRARAVVEQAREAVAVLGGFSPRDVVFTSGGTEANNLAVLRPFLDDHGNIGPGTIVTSRLEHPSVVRIVELLAARKVSVHWVAIEPGGAIAPEAIRDALAKAPSDAPRLVVVQAVNHETGVIQSIPEIARLVESAGAELHVDAVQAAGRLDASTWQGAHTLALASHKIRGPKGIGALLGRPGIVPRPFLRGGAQERGLRPGTVDPVAAAGFGAAAERAAICGPARYAALRPLRDRLERALLNLSQGQGAEAQDSAEQRANTQSSNTQTSKGLWTGARRNGEEPRAPHVTNVSLAGWPSDELAAALDLEGICISAGSACAAGTAEPSPVIAAMLGEARARSAVRFSLGEETTEEHVDQAIAAWHRVVRRQGSRG